MADAFDGTSARPPERSFAVAAGVFLRSLGLIYAVAFGSLATQIRGLVGQHGILPSAPILESVRAELGAKAILSAPTIFLLGCSDATLEWVCWVGTLLGVAVAFGLLQAPLLAVEWALFLSVCVVGQDFLGFQWDGLLLEAGFLAIWLAPWRPWTRWRGLQAPPNLTLWLLRFLLFRLMFASGVVKLGSHDPVWRDLSALQFHFETQPLPAWTAFFAHHLPAGLLTASTFVMFVIELVMPFGIFLPRPARLAAFVSLASLQLLIALTGNYCFFNALTFALCLLLVDDAWVPERWRPPTAPRPVAALPIRVAGQLSATVWLLLSGVALAGSLGVELPRPARLEQLERAIGPFRTINGYGLFAVMTTKRDEITVEGSNDGVEWRPYEFKWKPGDPHRRPEFVAPLQPRLDWQMWFAALGSWRRSHWFHGFLERLLEGSPEVLELLGKNPFPEGPPRQIRARIQPYHFSDWEHWRATGEWWTLGPPEIYSQALTRSREAGAP